MLNTKLRPVRSRCLFSCLLEYLDSFQFELGSEKLNKYDFLDGVKHTVVRLRYSFVSYVIVLEIRWLFRSVFNVSKTKYGHNPGPPRFSTIFFRDRD